MAIAVAGAETPDCQGSPAVCRSSYRQHTRLTITATQGTCSDRDLMIGIVKGLPVLRQFKRLTVLMCAFLDVR